MLSLHKNNDDNQYQSCNITLLLMKYASATTPPGCMESYAGGIHPAVQADRGPHPPMLSRSYDKSRVLD